MSNEHQIVIAVFVPVGLMLLGGVLAFLGRVLWAKGLEEFGMGLLGLGTFAGFIVMFAFGG